MRYLVLSLLVGCLGCPGAPTINTPPDAGQSEADMTFGQADAGSDGSNLNTALSDAGVASVAPTSDAGIPEQETEVICGAQSDTTLSLAWADGNLLPRLNVTGGSSISGHAIGSATRSEVGAVFEAAPRTDQSLPYRWICDDHGLTFDFVDTADSNNLLDAEANGSDTLSRIVVDNSSSLVFLGQVISTMTPTNLMAAVGDTAYFVHEYPETLQMVVFPERGFSFLTATTGDEQPIAGATEVMEGELLSLTFFKPQDADNWGASFDLSAASIALESGSLTTSQGFTGGSDFNAVVDRLGTNYDVNGTIEEEDFKANITTYASLGLRFVEGCGANPIFPIGDRFICSGKVTVLMISSPFMGIDENTGLRLGSAWTDVESALGEGVLRLDDETGSEVYVYGSSSPKVGVIYGSGTDGIQRVAAFILNYIDENELP